ncbi:DUF4129 domain-containing protein [Sandarakinorhabdus sp.]|uniref:DUF4129 domain-containing protein n=1 Tax=Sandarakinorhabdus sp. TaxID=1916663 RepID=UPI00286DC2D3|nr:DUF4129 domain-containing protein [Sandarakinorhabdus sp.]
MTVKNSDAAVAEAHRALLADGQVQFQFSDPPAPDPAAANPWRWLADLLAWIFDNAPWLKYVLIALGVALLARLLWTLWQRWQRRSMAPATPDDGWRPEAQAARDLLAQADALAAAGEYGAAAHLLLLRSVEHMAARDPRLMRASLTSRDIARLPGLAPPVASAFESIADVVERWLFAAAPANHDDWTSSRLAYASVAVGGGAGGR